MIYEIAIETDRDIGYIVRKGCNLETHRGIGHIVGKGCNLETYRHIGHIVSANCVPMFAKRRYRSMQNI